MNVAMFISVGLGYIGGVAAALFLGRRIVAVVLRAGQFQAAQRRSIVRMAVAGGLVALVPALLLGTLVGATLGGAYAGAVSNPGGGVLAGTAVGMFAVVGLIMCVAVAIGAYFGRFIARGDIS